MYNGSYYEWLGIDQDEVDVYAEERAEDWREPSDFDSWEDYANWYKWYCWKYPSERFGKD